MSFVLTARINGEERIISFGSKNLSKRQQKLSTHALEVRAMVWAVKANAAWLDHHDYVVEQDYRPLQAYRSAIAYYWQS